VEASLGREAGVCLDYVEIRRCLFTANLRR